MNRNYVDQATALAQNLTFASGNTLILRADSKTTLSSSGPSRNSVRIRSVKTYTTHVSVCVAPSHLVMVQVNCLIFSQLRYSSYASRMRHMACCLGNRRSFLAKWWGGRHRRFDICPIFLHSLTSQRNFLCYDIFHSKLNISMYQEFDLTVIVYRVEGVNDQTPNAMTLHTGANCNMPASRTQTGTATLNNCDVNANGNSGCGVQAPTPDSYGPAFNNAGGGFYAMERTSTFIKVWFWGRNAGNVPAEVRSGGNSINTDTWVSVKEKLDVVL